MPDSIPIAHLQGIAECAASQGRRHGISIVVRLSETGVQVRSDPRSARQIDWAELTASVDPRILLRRAVDAVIQELSP